MEPVGHKHSGIVVVFVVDDGGAIGRSGAVAGDIAVSTDRSNRVS